MTMNPRLDKLETDVSAVQMEIKVMQATTATKEDLQLLRLDMQTGFDALTQKIDKLSQRFDSELPHFATKEELQELKSDMRTWVIGTGITLFVALSGIQFSLFSILKDALPD